MNQEEFEKKLMDKLLNGDDIVLKSLMEQYLSSKIKSRDFTGAGFYTFFTVKSGIAPIVGRKNFEIDDVFANYNKIDGAFGFVLFIRNGYLSSLEGYTLVSDIWPNDYSGVVLIHDGPGGKRDFVKLRTKWSR
jgi:hypothetical protein